MIVIVTSLSGANDWQIMENLANSMSKWISQFVDVSGGIPSAHTIEKTLMEVMNLLKEKGISFDGKTLRGTATSEVGKQAIHVLHAWSVENGICIGQKKSMINRMKS